MIVTEGSRYLAVVPARGGSKGIPRKNLVSVAGRPLLAWTIDSVRSAIAPIRLVVSTDDEEIAALASELGAEVPSLRPPSLSTDESPSEDALLHSLDEIGSDAVDAVIMLQPTSPLRLDGTLDAAIELFERTGADSLVSVVESSPFLWSGTQDDPQPRYDVDRRPRRQELTEDQRLYRENGSIYVSSVSVLRSRRNRLGGKTVMYVMDPREGVDIDDELDVSIVAGLIEGRS
jgi:N-acylneuraminate cytidylyltransferase